MNKEEEILKESEKEQRKVEHRRPKGNKVLNIKADKKEKKVKEDEKEQSKVR